MNGKKISPLALRGIIFFAIIAAEYFQKELKRNADDRYDRDKTDRTAATDR